MLLWDLSVSLWPASKPTVPTVTTPCWFGDGHAKHFRKLLPADLRVYLELGSWLGASAGFVLKHWPQASVIAVDHFKGSPEHYALGYDFLPNLYEHFCQNLWEYRDRLYPLRMDSAAGLLYLHNQQIQPDVIYVDAGHDTCSAFRDVCLSAFLFPDSLVFGDDWLWPTVRTAVEQAAPGLGREIQNEGNLWWLTRTS